jgi:hypothetical protein
VLQAALSTAMPVIDLPAMHTCIMFGQNLHFGTVRTVDWTKDRSERGPVHGPRNVGTGPAVQSSVFPKGLKTGPDRTDGTLPQHAVDRARGSEKKRPVDSAHNVVYMYAASLLVERVVRQVGHCFGRTECVDTGYFAELA